MKCYFNLVNGPERIADKSGVEVKDLDQARLQGLKAIEELREENGAASREWKNWRLEVTDSTGALLFSISLGETFH
ncbi:DUF6894 family protein [Microvirga roseola]|uniref:DUF6894 family protein n=1 Tax=Microvirga roseola TaxID=2883126 RepID=UPI001E3B1271|nr:hypothetical protein [Microvirga roseola]